LEFFATVVAVKEAGGNDGDEERHRVERLFEALLPVIAPLNDFAVLEDGELDADLHPDFVAQALA
jgi:hypothetical protein